MKYLSIFFLSILFLPSAFSQDSTDQFIGIPIQDTLPYQPTILDTIASDPSNSCIPVEYSDFLQFLWYLPDQVHGDSVYAMLFTANKLDTVKLVEFYTYVIGSPGGYGNNDIYVTIRDDSSGFPSTVLYTDTIYGGTYPSYPNWVTVPMNVVVNGSFHVALAVSDALGGYETILSDDGITGPNIERSHATGSNIWNQSRKWYSMKEHRVYNVNFSIRALVCNSEYTDCSSLSCFNYSPTNLVWKLPDAQGNFMQAVKYPNYGDACRINTIGIEFTWPAEEDSVPLYSDSTEVIIFEDDGGVPGTELGSIVLQPEDFAGAMITPSAGRKEMYLDFFPLGILPTGDYWIGVKSFAPDSSTGIRLISDQGGSSCSFSNGYVQYSSGWEYIADVWSLPSNAAMSASVEYCCPHNSTIEVPTDFSTIQQAIDYAQSGDIITVLPGTYYENLDFSGKSITVTSLFAATKDASMISSTIISGVDFKPVVTFKNHEMRDTKLVGFTIQDGNSALGGGIFCDTASPTIQHNIITNNDGGGRGGGIYSVDARPLIDNNIISHNTATLGGGMGVFDGIPDLNQNSFVDNTANIGGAIYILNGVSTINSTTFYKNSAQQGGVFYNNTSGLGINNGTFVSNKSYSTGLFDSYQGVTNFAHCIFAFNTSPTSMWYCHTTIGDIRVECSNLFSNGNDGWDFCDGEPEVFYNNISQDPLFCNWPTGDFQLNSFSSCTDYNSPCGQMGAFGVGCFYLCGDVDGDFQLTINDVNFIRQYYFECDEAPYYFSAGDPNCDGKIDLADVLFLSEHILNGGPAPCCP